MNEDTKYFIERKQQDIPRLVHRVVSEMRRTADDLEVALQCNLESGNDWSIFLEVESALTHLQSQVRLDTIVAALTDIAKVVTREAGKQED